MHTRRVLPAGIAAFACGFGCPGIVNSRDSGASHHDAAPGADPSAGDSRASDDGGPTLDGVVPKDAGVIQDAGSDAGAGPCDRTMTHRWPSRLLSGASPSMATVGVLWQVSKTGGGVTLIATTSSQVYDLAVDGTCVYYVDTGGVMRVSK
jgi:hypothetical protein